MSGQVRKITYQIDGDNRIIAVSEGWREFAAGNHAANLTPEEIVGRPLLEFIDGMEVRHLYEMLLSRVRDSGQPVQFRYRCDSPTLRRYMRMTVRPTRKPRVLEFVSVAERFEERPPVRLFDPLPERDRERLLKVCSWCKKIETGPQGWVEAEVAVNQLGLFDAASLPALTHGICPPCHDSALAAVRSA